MANSSGPFSKRVRDGLAAGLVLVALFLIGRQLLPYAIDFPVYYKASQSLLSGRTDLYAASFALDPPMRYVYPPLFVVLFAPLAVLAPATAFGLWFAALASITGWVLWAAWRTWTPDSWRLPLVGSFTLALPFSVYGLRSSNVHLLVVMLAVAGGLAWGRDQPWRAGACWAFGGALKVFPLLLLPVLLLMRQWRLAWRMVLLSALFWLAPSLWFGPRRAIELEGEWFRAIVVDAERLRQESRLDVSLPRAVERLLAPADYTERIDRAYPQVNALALPPRATRAAGQLALWIVALPTLAALFRLRGLAQPRRSVPVAAVLSLFLTAQLLLGPYTTLLYLCAWIVPALALPHAGLGRSRSATGLFVAVGAANIAVFTIPGGATRRAIEAAGFFTAVDVVLWALSLWIVLRLAPRSANRSPG